MFKLFCHIILTWLVDLFLFIGTEPIIMLFHQNQIRIYNRNWAYEGNFGVNFVGFSTELKSLIPKCHLHVIWLQKSCIYTQDLSEKMKHATQGNEEDNIAWKLIIQSTNPAAIKIQFYLKSSSGDLKYFSFLF